MKEHCVFRKCRFNCKSSSDHKVTYAKMKFYYEYKNIKNEKLKKEETKPLSSKVNWKKYNELFSEK